MEEMILQFISIYGWQLALLACSGIPLLGIFKAFHVFDKIPDTKRKYVYGFLSSLFSIAAAGVYLLVIDKFTYLRFGMIAGGIYGVNQTVYSAYETWGIRSLFRKIGNLVINLLCKNKIKDSKQALSDDGLVEDIEDEDSGKEFKDYVFNEDEQNNYWEDD